MKILPYIFAFALGVSCVGTVTAAQFPNPYLGGSNKSHTYGGQWDHRDNGDRGRGDHPVIQPVRPPMHRDWDRSPGWDRGPGWGWGRRPVIVRPEPGIGAGTIIGGIIGYIIGSNANKPDVADDEPEGAIPAWSEDWYNFCNQKYKSFDAKTGFWVDNDGKQHFCVIK